MLKIDFSLHKQNFLIFVLLTILTFNISLTSMETTTSSVSIPSQTLIDNEPAKNANYKLKAPNVFVSQIYEINDDNIGNSIGDGDNKVDAGEKIELRLQLQNNGDQAVTNVYGKLTSTNLFVTISSSNQSYLGIGVGETRLSTSYYLIEFNSKFNVSDSVNFDLVITANEGIWFDSFNLTIVGVPTPIYYGFSVTNELNGDLNADGDEIIDPGEIVYLKIYVENIGHSNFFDVNGYLTTIDSLVTITDPTGTIGTINVGSFDYGNFIIQISGACTELHIISFNLSLTDKFSKIWNINFEVTVSGFPEYELSNFTFFEYIGDGDGIMDAGEQWATQMNIRNSGEAIGKNIEIYLGSSESILTFFYYEDHNITIDDLPVGFSEFVISYYYWRFIISDLATENQTLEFFVVITDDNDHPATIINKTAQVIGVADYELLYFEIDEYCYYSDEVCNGRIDAGDTFIANISIINVGKTTGRDVKVYLFSNDDLVEFYYDNGTYYDFGALEEGEQEGYYGYYWEFTISEKAKTGRVIYFTIVVSDASNREWFFQINITVEHGPIMFINSWEGIAWIVGGIIFLFLIFIVPVIKKRVKNKQNGNTLQMKIKSWQKDQKEKHTVNRAKRNNSRAQREKEREAIRQDKERDRIARINANEKELLEKFENILKISESVEISRVAKSLGLSDYQLFEKLIQWQDVLPFKIDGKYIEVKNSADFIQSIHEKIAEISKYYSCYHCGFPIESTTKVCPDCKSEILQCAVCKLPISFGDDIGICSLCEATGHLAHMQEWVKIQGKCPLCLQKLPLKGIIQNINADKNKN
ncbi:MAG: hypothetical protein JXA54_09675 [Candidatus Heimdallarchaeota archaeon]|nr:hypothetical protein [Candidatus Heimdallarchaeota archaeon]